MTQNDAFDWLQDTRPIYAAEQAWESGKYDENVVFHVLFPEKMPFHVACGAALVVEHVKKFRFSPDVIQRIGQITDAQGRSAFGESFLNHLQRLKLRVKLLAPPEGSILLPGEPLLIVQGPLIQIRLLESAFRYLMLQSTQVATRAALTRWTAQDLDEDDTPSLPRQTFTPAGWRTRAAYIGGASVADAEASQAYISPENTVLNTVTHANGEPLTQIRRLFSGQQPLGDLWLTDAQERRASLSKKTAQLVDATAQTTRTFEITRFNNLYQPVLVKGHPVLASPRTGYLRQRCLKQLEAFAVQGLVAYPQGWLE